MSFPVRKLSILFKLKIESWQIHILNCKLCFILISILSGLFSSLVIADIQHFHDYQYDSAGNIVRIKSIQQSKAPKVNNLNPEFINLGRILSITATGTDLMAAAVSTNTPGLIISDVKTTQTSVTFILKAGLNTPLGTAQIFFTTLFGSDSIEIAIAEAIPILNSRPSPIVISSGQQPEIVHIYFDEPRLTEEIYTISILDSLTATVANSTFLVAKGSTKAQFQLTGLREGSTILNIALDEKFFSFNFQVFVGQNFVGQSDISAPEVGIYVQPSKFSTYETKQVSKAVGIFFAKADNVQTTFTSSKQVGLFLPKVEMLFQQNSNSPAVGVYVDSITNNQPLSFSSSKNVGVYLKNEDPVILQQINSSQVGINVSSGNIVLNDTIFSKLVGVVSGPVITHYEPKVLQAGNQQDIVISGINLNDVAEITINSESFITINSLITAQDGASITLSVNADLFTPSGDYQIIITSRSGNEIFMRNSNLILTIP